jgi:hypothetical protein
LSPGADPDHHDPSPHTQRPQVGREVGGPDQLENHVEGAVLLEPFRGDHLGPETRHRVSVIRIANRGGHPRSGGVAELDGGRAHPAGATVDQQALAGLQARLAEHPVVRGGEHLGDGPGRGPVEVAGDRHQDPLVNYRELRLSSAGHDPHHAVAELEPVGSGAALDHLAGQLEARDVLGCAGRSGVEPASLHHVGAVQAGRPDPHQALAGTGRRVRMVLDGQVLVFDRDGPHGALGSEPYS